MSDLVQRLRKGDPFGGVMQRAADRIEALEAELAEMTRRRDEWRKKAEGYDAVRMALRGKVGTPWPPHMSRLLWAGIAADEKKRADDAEAALLAADEAISAMNFTVALAHHIEHGDGSTILLMDEILSAQNMALAAYRRARWRALVKGWV